MREPAPAAAAPVLGGGRDAFAQVMAASPDAMVVYLAGSGIRDVNPRFEAMFGWSREELVGRSYDVLVPERLHEELRARVSAYLAEDPPEAVAWRPDIPAIRKDGSEFPIQYSAVPLPEPGGLWLVVTVHDVSELRASEARVSQESRRYLTLARLNEAVAQARDEATLFAEACRVAVEVGGFAGAWVAEGSAGRPLRRVASAGVVEAVGAELDASLARGGSEGSSPSRRAVESERAVYAPDLLGRPDDVPWVDTARRAGFAAAASLPLFRGGRAVAALTFIGSDPGSFDTETCDLLEGLARNVSAALEAFADQARLERLAGHRRDLVRRLMEVQESDRDKIAADIHDDSVQALAAVDLRLGMVRRQARQLAPDLEPALEQTWAVVSSATASLRHLLFSLEAPDVEAGLRASLLEAAEHVFLDTRVRLELHSDDSELPALLLGQALRIVKEALDNVLRHASAGTVWIDVNALDDGVEIRVRDDGTGVRPGAGQREGRPRGIETMRERAELSGGRCAVLDGPEGRGTEVVLWLPREVRLEPR